MASKSPDLNPMEYHVWLAMQQAYHSMRWTDINVAVNLGQPTSGTDLQGCENDWRLVQQLVVDTSNILRDSGIVNINR